jgi:hypothetical protein
MKPSTKSSLRQAMLVSAAGHLQIQAPVVYSHANFVILDFKMKHISKSKQELLDAKTDGLHINSLVFLAAIINIWLVLKLVMQLSVNPMGYYIIDLLLDNMSALSSLSWMHLTAQTCDPKMLVMASHHLTCVQPKHVAGDSNFKADTLSRSKNGQVPSWEHAILQCTQLHPCQICLLR